MTNRRLAAACTAAIALISPLLHGCAAVLVAAQVIPGGIGMLSAANAEDVDPWRRYPSLVPAAEDLATVTVRIQRAECGDAQSQYWLASTLDDEVNTTPNYVEIYKWYRLAHIGGISLTSAELSALEAQMSEADIAKAQALAAEWRPATEGCAPGG